LSGKGQPLKKRGGGGKISGEEKNTPLDGGEKFICKIEEREKGGSIYREGSGCRGGNVSKPILIGGKRRKGK